MQDQRVGRDLVWTVLFLAVALPSTLSVGVRAAAATNCAKAASSTSQSDGEPAALTALAIAGADSTRTCQFAGETSALVLTAGM